MTLLEEKHLREYQACIKNAQKEQLSPNSIQSSQSEGLSFEMSEEEEDNSIKANTYPMMEQRGNLLKEKSTEPKEKSPQKSVPIVFNLDESDSMELIDLKKAKKSSESDRNVSLPSLRQYIWKGLEVLLDGLQKFPSLAASPPNSNQLIPDPNCDFF